MAEGVGAEVDLATVPLKYPGLAAVGDLAVRGPGADGHRRPARPPAGAAPCAAPATASSWPSSARFTGDGRLVVRHHGDVVLDLDDGVPARRAAAPPDDRRAAGAGPQPGRRASSTTRRRRCCGLLAHPNIAVQGGDHPPLRPRDRRRHGRAPARRRGRRWARRRCRAGRPSRRGTASRSASASTRGTGCSTRRRWPTPWSTRRSATSSPSAPTPTGSPCSTTSRGATRAGPTTLGALVAAVDGCHDAAARPRRPVRLGQGLAEQRVHRRRRRPARRAADAGHHRRRPRRPTSAARVTPELSARRQRRGAPRSHGGRVRRQPPRPRARAPPVDPGTVPQPDPDAPDRYRRLHRAIRDGLVRACHDLSEGGLAVALAEMCIAGRLGIERRRPARRPTSRRRCSPSPPAACVVEVAPRRPRCVRPTHGRRRSHRLGTVTGDPHAASARRWRAPDRRPSCARTRSARTGAVSESADRDRGRRTRDQPRRRRRAGARPGRRRAVGGRWPAS